MTLFAGLALRPRWYSALGELIRVPTFSVEVDQLTPTTCAAAVSARPISTASAPALAPLYGGSCSTMPAAGRCTSALAPHCAG
ncbi:hypothetical protein ACPA9J_14495 [Pseudomonas aeruginosa]